MPRIDEEWPTVVDSHRAVVVLSLGTIPDVPSSKVLKSLRRWASDPNDNGGQLFIAGSAQPLRRTGQRRRGGRGRRTGSCQQQEQVFGASANAVARGMQWIAGLD